MISASGTALNRMRATLARMIVLYCTAGVAELLGLFLALHGLQRTWAEYMPTEPLMSAFVRLTAGPVAQLGKRTGQRIQRAFRRRGPQTIVSAGDIASLSAVGTVRARVGWGPLPSIEDDPQAFAAEIHRRLQELHGKTQDAQESLADDRADRDRMLSALEERIAGRVSSLETQTKGIATDGVVEQIFGWSLLVIGVALGTLGNVLQVARKG